jgi:hypothetical protein
VTVFSAQSAHCCYKLTQHWIASAGWNQWSLQSSTMQNYNSDNWGFEGIGRLLKVKVLSIITMFLLLGCAPSTPDLIEQAHLTGDWTRVNQRIAAMERRQGGKTQSCPAGSIGFCTERFGDKTCSCARRSEIRQVFGSNGY